MHAADDQAAVLSSLRKINITEATFSPSPCRALSIGGMYEWNGLQRRL